MIASERTADAIRVIERLFRHFGTWPDYEMVLRRSYETFLKPDSVIFDIGAHSGTHLEHFVRIAKDGMVVAFEPLPDLYAGLVACFKPDGDRLTIYQMALSREKIDHASFVR